MISGAQAMVECLRQEGVSITFGYPGATIAPFFDALSRSAGIRNILTRTEQGAGHSASGYARIQGRPGVCIATSGPGATNLFTALATAYSDSIPLVAITGQVATYQLGRDVFQEVDTTGAAEAFTKYSYLVKSVQDIPRVFKEAFHIASTGRQGPVLIDMPMDIQKQEMDFAYPQGVSIRGYKPTFDGHPMQVRKVAGAIGAAKRPLICSGGGVFSAHAEAQVRQLAEDCSIPVVSTMMGIGVLPPGHPLFYGMVGQSGIAVANRALMESDLLILVGARVGDRAVLSPEHLESNATVVHIDIDAAEIGKNLGTTIPLVGDAAQVLTQLIQKKPRGDWADWVAELDVQKAEVRAKRLARRPKSENTIEPNAFVRLLCANLPEGTIYVADVGQNQIWSAKNFSAHGRFMTTGGMGTMGYSIPAAIGAKLCAPDKTVLAVCGDGSFQMSMNELATMRQHGAPIKVIVMRNGVLGMVREIQHAAYGGQESAIDLSGSPDFGTIAAAYGMAHSCIHSIEEAEGALAEMLKNEDAYLLECVVDPREVTA